MFAIFAIDSGQAKVKAAVSRPVMTINFYVICDLASPVLFGVYCVRFKPSVVKECIRETVRERLSGVQYDPELVPELSCSLAESIKDKVKSERRLLIWIMLVLLYFSMIGLKEKTNRVI